MQSSASKATEVQNRASNCRQLVLPTTCQACPFLATDNHRDTMRVKGSFLKLETRRSKRVVHLVVRGKGVCVGLLLLPYWTGMLYFSFSAVLDLCVKGSHTFRPPSAI